jgi:hypothetical protein
LGMIDPASFFNPENCSDSWGLYEDPVR